MKNILISLSLMFPSVTFACPTLEGTWSSSLEKFESFNQQWAKVNSRPWSFMVQTQGHETIIFNSNNKMHISTPEIEVEMGDKAVKLPANEEQISLDILGCTDKSIVLKYVRNGTSRISQLHFEDDHTFWEYMGVAGKDGNSHIREYYTKTN